MVEDFDGCAVSETQAFTAKACKPCGIHGLNDFYLGGLEASLVCVILNDELFDFIGTDGRREWPGVLRNNKGDGAC